MHIVLGGLIYGYEYGAMNRLSRSWNEKGQEAFYLYNGLGQRTGKSVNGDEEDYLLDLTKGYHNLLGIQKEESGQRFILMEMWQRWKKLAVELLEVKNKDSISRSALLHAG